MAGDTFSADWLALREPHDRAARDSAWATLTGGAEGGRLSLPGQRLDVLDLGCGTGANLRYLAPRLGHRHQCWTVVDHDAALLQRWSAQPASTLASSGPSGCDPGKWALEVKPRRLDLTRDLDQLDIPPAGLVTGSALLDLVSEYWLGRLVEACRRAGATFWFALSVDGRIEWRPHDADDDVIRSAFEAHQRRDKGFGPALGASAPRAAARCLRSAGYRVVGARSDWLLDGGASGPAHAADMLSALIDGMAEAATEQTPALATVANAWRERRHALIPRTGLRVGHVDLRAEPPAMPAAPPAGPIAAA